jgi:hypothetical protein
VRHVGTDRSGRCGPNIGRGRKAKKLLCFGDLASQGIGRITIALPSEGSLTHMG